MKHAMQQEHSVQRQDTGAAERAQAMKHAERVAAAVRLHRDGVTYRAIGEQLGCSGATALRWVRAALATRADAPKALIAAAVRDHRAESHRLLDAVVDANLDLAGTPGNGNLLVRTIETRARMEGLMAAPIPQPRAAAEEWQVVIADFETGEMVDSATGEVITPARTVRKAITE